MYERKTKKDILCPLEYGMDIFGGKWKSRIICVLFANGTMRYNSLRKELGNITDAVLAAMLKEMVADGLIGRQQYNEIPPKVEYALSEKGKSVLPILQSICLWSKDNAEQSIEKKLPPCISCTQI